MHDTSHNEPSTLPRVRALDGLRGLAVAAVLAYHAGFGWARGGFLGVSLFFTLSGFLITSLLLAERRHDGRVSLGSFWRRRARRLLPAALVALAGIVVFGATVATGSQVRSLRGDVLGALGYVANWHFIVAGSSYGDLWSSPSPVQHFWSLAIEEQLYLVLPLLVVGAFALGRGRLRGVAIALGIALAGSIAATFLVHDQLRAYYGTDVRGAELLAGALLAVAVAAWPTLRLRSEIGAVALAALVLAWATTSQHDGWLYHGGLLLHAALAVVVILAARSRGLLATALEFRPLRWLGRVSYGAYLYHWPIFLWLTAARTGLDGLPLAGLRIGVSLAAAAASAALLEEPIRAGRRLTSVRAPLALATTAAGVAVALVAVTVSPPASSIGIDLAAAPKLVAPSTVLASSNLGTTPTSVPAPPTSIAPAAPTTIPGPPGRPLRVYVAGDSNAYILGLRLQTWGNDHNVLVWASGWFGCHIVPGGTYRWAGVEKHTKNQCNSWATQRKSEIDKIKPDVVLVMYGSFDMLDRKWDGSDTWTHVGMPDFDVKLSENIAKMTDLLGSTGAHVVWATYPRIRTGVVDGAAPAHDFPESEDYRSDRLDTLIREAAMQRPFASVLELRRYMQAWPGGELDGVKRPDGVHPNEYEGIEIADWIGTQLTTDPTLR